MFNFDLVSYLTRVALGVLLAIAVVAVLSIASCAPAGAQVGLGPTCGGLNTKDSRCQPMAPTCVQAANYLTRTSAETSGTRRALSAMICGLVADGVITGTLSGSAGGCGTKLDAFYVLAQDGAADAVLNLCGTSYTITPNGSPAFAADGGYTGVAGSTTVFLDTGFNPSTAATPNFLLDTGHISVWLLTNAGPSGNFAASTRNTGTPGWLALIPMFTDNNFYCSVNTDGNDPAFGAVPNATGFFLCDRTSSVLEAAYRNGSQLTMISYNNNVLPNQTLYLLANHAGNGLANVGYGAQMATASVGRGLSASDVSSLNSRICTYLTSVHGSC